MVHSGQIGVMSFSTTSVRDSCRGVSREKSSEHVLVPSVDPKPAMNRTMMMSDAVAFNSRRANTVKFDTNVPFVMADSICPANNFATSGWCNQTIRTDSHVRRALIFQIMDMRNVLPSDSRATGARRTRIPRSAIPPNTKAHAPANITHARSPNN